MPSEPLVAALDAGTTGVRCVLFGPTGAAAASSYREFPQIYPRPGWVEHDPERILSAALEVLREATSGVGGSERVTALGITNQRETAVAWDSRTADPLCNAIVWQDRRTTERCEALRREGREAWVRERTGLPLDPYFSATKWEWMCREHGAVREAAASGRLRLGTVDAWLLYRLTGQAATDPTNASRTLLYNLHSGAWDPELLALFGLRAEWLPRVVPSVSAEGFGCLRGEVLGRPVPVRGCLGDQQSALFGHVGLRPGEVKNTYGTGSFLLMNTGSEPVASTHGLLGTVAYQIEGEPLSYGLEGSIFVTGAAVQWLRDGLGIIASAQETEALAESVPDNGGVYFVPAFAGLGAPYWDPRARGTLLGLTRGATRAHLARAALEAMAYQTRDVVEAMASETRRPLRELRVDGGAVENGFLCQFQADLLGVPVTRPAYREMTAQGAAYAAGLASGYWEGEEALRSLPRQVGTFEPRMPRDQADALHARWQEAVRRAAAWDDAVTR